MKKLLLAAVCGLALSACQRAAEEAPAPAAPAKPEVALYALDCGRIAVSDADIFADDGSFKGVSRDFVDPCYLIRHPSGDLLWDGGIPDALAANPDGLKSGPFTITVPKTFAAQLQELGLTAADIEYFSISHSHFDHLGNSGQLTAATFLVDKEERDWMFREEARKAEEFPTYAGLENAKTTLIEGDEDYDVFGDGSVKLVAAPGHTPGHRVALVQLPQSGPVLLTGDMYHLALAKETGARVIRQHVPEDFEALPRLPEALR